MLFRQEAIDHHRTSLCGNITLPVPPALTATTLFLAACLVAGAVFLATGTYTRRAHVPGFLVPQRGVTRIMPPRAGTVVALHVHEGDLVRAGDTLLTVSADQTNARGQAVDSAVLDTLREQAARLRDQMALEQSRATDQGRSAKTAIGSLENQLAALRAEHAIQLQRAAIALRDVQAASGLLARGDMSAVEARRRQDAYLSQRETESGMARAILDKQAELDRLHSQAADILPASAQRMAVLQGEEAEIEARMAEHEGSRGYLLTAPVAGRISSLQAWVGKDVDPGQPQMSIVPEGDALQAQLLVPARAIGFVRPGQAVRLSYDAFPSQEFGFAEGRVATISRTLLKPGEMVGPLSFDAPAFRVTVLLARQSIAVFGSEVKLQTDTPLQADIALETRSLLAWVMDPLHAMRARP